MVRRLAPGPGPSSGACKLACSRGLRPGLPARALRAQRAVRRRMWPQPIGVEAVLGSLERSRQRGLRGDGGSVGYAGRCGSGSGARTCGFDARSIGGALMRVSARVAARPATDRASGPRLARALLGEKAGCRPPAGEPTSPCAVQRHKQPQASSSPVPTRAFVNPHKKNSSRHAAAAATECATAPGAPLAPAAAGAIGIASTAGVNLGLAQPHLAREGCISRSYPVADPSESSAALHPRRALHPLHPALH